MSATTKDYITLIIQMVIGIPFAVLLVGALVFIPAFTLFWLEGWIFILVLFSFITGIFLYFLFRDPSTLQKRSKLSSDIKEVIFLTLFGIIFFLELMIPGLNRSILSFVPTLHPIIEIIGFIGLIISLIIIFLVMRENAYASKGVRIHEGHEVITTGPYSIIRHPMYAGFIIMVISIPLALGSVIALIPAILGPIPLIFRIRIEEELLLTELSGYAEYKENVRYKLIPYIY